MLIGYRLCASADWLGKKLNRRALRLARANPIPLFTPLVTMRVVPHRDERRMALPIARVVLRIWIEFVGRDIQFGLRDRVELPGPEVADQAVPLPGDRKSTRLNSSHLVISYAVFCLKK